MERTPLLRVQERVKSWINPKSFNVQTFRDLLMGNVLNTTIGEVLAYKLMFQDIQGGELPSYVPDILIAVLSALEALAAPYLSWLGFKKRRFVLAIYTLVVLLSSVSLYGLPSATIREESEFCDAANSKNDISYQGMSARSIVRLTILIVVTLTFQMSRVTTWTHGLAYCDEYAPERISVHYGVLLIGRVVVLVLGNKMIPDLTNLLLLQVSMLVVGFLVNLIQLFCIMPKYAPEVNGVRKTELPLIGRGEPGSLNRRCKLSLSTEFPVSMTRVVSRSLVLAVMLASSLLAAALWGIGYNRDDIVKVKFLMPPSLSFSFDVVLRHAFIIFPIALAGVKFSAPVLLEYCKKKALQQAVVMTTFAFIFFVLFTVVPKCDQGFVVGLRDAHYNYPTCSLSCGCKPKWAEFNPVCVTNNMTTYLSPCHAGCSGTENFNGIQVYTGCSCSGIEGVGEAVPGACAADCRQQQILHDMLFIVATTFTMLALQAQGVLILKVVDPRDKSVAMGLLLGMVAMVTFVCGHLMFMAIRVATCRWYEGGECHLQTTKFPYLVGYCSSFLVLLSALISIASFVFTREYETNRITETSI